MKENKMCPYCKSRKIGEADFHDDMDGNLTCFKCSKKFKRWQKDEEDIMYSADECRKWSSTNDSFKNCISLCSTKIKEMADLGGRQVDLVAGFDLPNDNQILNLVAEELRNYGFSVFFGILNGREVMKVRW